MFVAYDRVLLDQSWLRWRDEGTHEYAVLYNERSPIPLMIEELKPLEFSNTGKASALH